MLAPTDEEPRALRSYLLEQAAALRAADVDIRRGEAEGVHDLRVAGRRIRSALGTYGPAFDPAASKPLKAEVGWLGRAFGPARDADVVRERLRVLLDADHVLDVGAEVDDIVALVDDSAEVGDASLREVLDSPRYGTVLDAVDAFADAPPWTPPVDDDPRRLMRRRIRKEWEALALRVDRVVDLEPGTAPDELLHDARRAAKRVRYALEVAELVWPNKPKRLRRCVHRLTDVLGERQDTAVMRSALRGLAARPDVDQPSRLVLVRLERAEEERAAALEAEFKEAWAAAVERRRTWP